MNYTVRLIQNILSLNDAITAEIKRHDFLHENIIIVVPDKLSLTIEKEVLSALDLTCTFNIEVSTIKRLCKDLLDTDNVFLTKEGAALLVYDILLSEVKNFKCFNIHNCNIENASEIAATLSQLKASKITADELIDFKSENKFLQNKINDLGLIYSHYENKKAGMLDDSDMIVAGIMNMKKSDAHYIFAGYDDITSLGYMFIENVIKNCASTCVLCYSTDKQNKHIYNKDMYHKLYQLGNILDIKVNTFKHFFKTDDLHQYLSNYLFSTDKLSYFLEPHFNISTYYARAIDEELEFVFRDIRNRILQGAQFSQFSIGVFDLESVAPHIRHYLNKYELNAYTDTKTRFSDTELYKFIMSVLAFRLNKAHKTDNLDFISNYYTPISSSDKQKLTTLCKTFDIEYAFYNFKTKDKNISALLKNIKQLFNYNKKCKNAAQFNDYIRNVLSLVDFQNTNQSLFDNSVGQNDLYQAKIYSQLTNVLESIFSQLIFFDREITLEQYIDLFKNISKETFISSLPVSLDSIQILDAYDMFQQNDFVYLINCDAGTAPKYLDDSGLILDKEIGALHFNEILAPSIAHTNRLSKFRLYNLSMSFKHSLCISLHSTNNEDLSILSKELSSRLSYGMSDDSFYRPMVYTKSTLDKKFFLTPLSKLDAAETILMHEHDGNYDELKEYYRGLLNINFNNYYIENINAFPHNTISITQLENYFDCPFRHYADKVLNLKDDMHSDIQKIDVGNLMHSILEEYYEHVISKKIIDIEKLIDNCIEKYLSADKNIALSSQKNEVWLNKLKSEAMRIISFCKEADKNTLYIPKYTEFKLAEVADGDAVFFNSKTKKLKLVGSVDRIDFNMGNFRIIDYKTGAIPQNHINSLYYGNKIQLFVYGRAIQKAFKANCGGLFYLPVHNKFEQTEGLPVYRLQGVSEINSDNLRALDINLKNTPKSRFLDINTTTKNDITMPYKNTDRIMTSDEMDKFLNYSIRISQQAIDDIETGNITPCPIEKENGLVCKNCKYLQLCKLKTQNILPRQKQFSIDKKTVFKGEI